MGIGTAKGPDGTLYLCQLFRGWTWRAPIHWMDPVYCRPMLKSQQRK
jgi:hypothetical protein